MESTMVHTLKKIPTLINIQRETSMLLNQLKYYLSIYIVDNKHLEQKLEKK
mgnify:CR=1 FL=1